MKTFRKYLNECSFGEIWDSLAEFFGEPEAMRAVYSDYYDKLKALPEKRCKGVIELSSSRPAAIQPEGMNAAPDWLIDKKVKTTEQDSAYVSAVLLYWASLHTFYTSKEHFRRHSTAFLNPGASLLAKLKTFSKPTPSAECIMSVKSQYSS